MTLITSQWTLPAIFQLKARHLTSHSKCQAHRGGTNGYNQRINFPGVASLLDSNCYGTRTGGHLFEVQTLMWCLEGILGISSFSILPEARAAAPERADGWSRLKAAFGYSISNHCLWKNKKNRWIWISKIFTNLQLIWISLPVMPRRHASKNYSGFFGIQVQIYPFGPCGKSLLICNHWIHVFVHSLALHVVIPSKTK